MEGIPVSRLCRLRNAKHGDDGQWAHNEIKSLRQQLEIAEACLAGDNALIVGLKNDIAEKDAEIDRLSRLNSSYSNLTKAQECQITALRNRLYELKGADKTLDSERDANATLTEQLAASQAREVQLREVLHKLACLGNGTHYGTSDGNRIAQVALALPQDTTALSAMIAKAGEVVRERCDSQVTTMRLEYHHNDCSLYAGNIAEEIRALPGVTLEDLQK